MYYHFGCLDPPVKKTPKARGYQWYCEECDSDSEDEEDGDSDEGDDLMSEDGEVDQNGDQEEGKGDDQKTKAH